MCQNNDLNSFFDYLSSQRGLSENTLRAYQNDLLKFFDYLSSENLSIEQLKRNHIRGFLAELNREKLNNNTINRILAALKSYIRYKKRFGYKDSASILEIESLKTTKYLPKFLFEDEFEKLISFEVTQKEDYRDIAIFELIFSTGLRVSEVVSLNTDHINSKENTIKIIGKGNKERVVLFGNICRERLDSYLKIRAQFKPEDNALFLGVRGKRLSDRAIRYILEKRIAQISLTKNISPHSLRHSFATTLIRNGADIRTVQILLGHSNLSTTQIYTHLGIDELKDIHFKYHPHGK